MESSKFDINCIDPLGRTALVLAIENENMGLIDVLLKHGIRSGDSLLHAISEEYVEAVETLLRHEESIHTPNTPYVSLERRMLRSDVIRFEFRDASSRQDALIQQQGDLMRSRLLTGNFSIPFLLFPLPLLLIPFLISLSRRFWEVLGTHRPPQQCLH